MDLTTMQDAVGGQLILVDLVQVDLTRLEAVTEAGLPRQRWVRATRESEVTLPPLAAGVPLLELAALDARREGVVRGVGEQLAEDVLHGLLHRRRRRRRRRRLGWCGCHDDACGGVVVNGAAAV